MNSTGTVRPEVQHFHDLLTQFETAMLITRAEDGSMRARPMGIAKVEADSSLWFFTSVESGKAHEIERDKHVHVTLQNDRGTYVSLSGAATLERDRDRMAELWRDAFKIWFPSGPNDPEVALIHVIPKNGEYWDSEGFNKIKYLLAAARAYAAGEKFNVDDTEQHAAVDLEDLKLRY
jgi:general stress protein 26